MSNKNQRQKGCTTCDPVQKRSDKEQGLYDIAADEVWTMLSSHVCTTFVAEQQTGHLVCEWCGRCDVAGCA